MLYPLSTWQTSHKINQPRVTQQAGAFPLTPVLLPAFPAAAGSPLPFFGEPFPEPQPLVPLQVAAGEATTTSPPVKPDAGRLEAVVGVVVDELCVHGGVPHHLLAQSQAPLSAPAPGRARCARQAGEVSGKPQTPWGPRGLSQQAPGLCMKATRLPLPPEQPFTHGVINLGCAGFMPPGFYPSCTCALLPDASAQASPQDTGLGALVAQHFPSPASSLRPPPCQLCPTNSWHFPQRETPGTGGCAQTHNKPRAGNTL